MSQGESSKNIRREVAFLFLITGALKLYLSLIVNPLGVGQWTWVLDAASIIAGYPDPHLLPLSMNEGYILLPYLPL